MAEKRKTETKKPYQAKKRTKLAVETYDTVQQETHPKTDTDTDMMLVNADSKDKTSLMSFFKLKNEKTVSVEKEDKKTATSPPPKNTAAPVSVTKEKTPATTTASVDQEVDQEIEVAKAEEEESKIESKTLKEAAKTLMGRGNTCALCYSLQDIRTV
ncbi:hypothetical protein BDF14DRAFT_313144 [Spinellus fusiger]|nr:hypothetical protein BDF14DRAFT_313144 [Spinellus fusiger]